MQKGWRVGGLAGVNGEAGRETKRKKASGVGAEKPTLCCKRRRSSRRLARIFGGLVTLVTQDGRSADRRRRKLLLHGELLEVSRGILISSQRKENEESVEHEHSVENWIGGAGAAR